MSPVLNHSEALRGFRVELHRCPARGSCIITAICFWKQLQGNTTASLGLIEGCLTAILAAAAFVVPRLGSAWFSRVERMFAKLAEGKVWWSRSLAWRCWCCASPCFLCNRFHCRSSPTISAFCLPRHLRARPARPIPLPRCGPTSKPSTSPCAHLYVDVLSRPGTSAGRGQSLFGNPWFGL